MLTLFKRALLTSRHSITMSRRTGTKRKAAEAAALNAKRARGETDLSDGLRWSHHGEVVKGVCPLMALTSPTLAGTDKVAGFDIDFTVIRTASGKKFAQGMKVHYYRSIYYCNFISFLKKYM